ncbi:DUF1343 domain-containing protein [Coraliomargarita akajimensis]|uniref:DUF1343 domain-containing protein n=1 Tax=Coraliomargarita akajimensis (strain DSM 45221 / IAM 15411 / JCM 23193 / KCTC 12865 / 04OKA010-24) TaxID=583355 RepID=D5EK05_CORAD|nr:DUF1343 domain-containing protein [Coraliomargarita akajimensis]ADE54754.1 conserved hypothetical protein [Coraliomargarita akajimensis DSM 45221]
MTRLFILCLGFLFVQLVASAAQPIYLGIDVLEGTGFKAIQGKRVGLLTHPAGVNRRGETSIQVLQRARNAKLVALFGPEHGIYGNEKANVPVDDKIDPRTGLPVYSLYGKFRSPSPKMLQGLDALVIDLQDVGVRSYTYVSCMLRAMEACFENGVEVIVLDRPNPLGGRKVDGPPLDKEWRSYVGDFFVPYVHGLTIGELARMAKHSSKTMRISESQRRAGKLTVIPMRGWNRDMLWTGTGLNWVPTSPYIPDLSAVLGYAMTGLGCQEGGFSHGIGTPYPFRFLRHSGKSAAQVKQALERRRIPGMSYRVIQTKTKSGYSVEGVYVRVNNWSQCRPTALSFHMMQLTAEWSASNPFASPKNESLFNKHVGSTAWWNEISIRGKNARVNEFLKRWASTSKSFISYSQQFWLYQ